MAFVRYATSGRLFFLESAGSNEVASGGFTTIPAGSEWPGCHAKFLLYSACNLLSAGIGQARHRFQKVLIMSLPCDNFFRTPNTSKDGKTRARPGGESATAELSLRRRRRCEAAEQRRWRLLFGWAPVLAALPADDDDDSGC